MSTHAAGHAHLIPGDAIETSPEWVTATRRCFPLLPDEIIREDANLTYAADECSCTRHRLCAACLTELASDRKEKAA